MHSTRDETGTPSWLSSVPSSLARDPGGPLARSDAQLRAEEPWPAEFGVQLMRRRGALEEAEPRGGDQTPTSPFTLEALLGSGEPWPVEAALVLLDRVASILDVSALAGRVIAPLHPACVLLEGPYLALRSLPHASAPARFVAPEQRDAQAFPPADARAAQFGLAGIAGELLGERLHVAAPARRGARATSAAAECARLHLRAELAGEVARVLAVGRMPARDERYPSAAAFVAALREACALPADPGAPRVRLDADVARPVALPVTPPSAPSPAPWTAADASAADAVPRSPASAPTTPRRRWRGPALVVAAVLIATASLVVVLGERVRSSAPAPRDTRTTEQAGTVIPTPPPEGSVPSTADSLFGILPSSTAGPPRGRTATAAAAAPARPSRARRTPPR